MGKASSSGSSMRRVPIWRSVDFAGEFGKRWQHGILSSHPVARFIASLKVGETVEIDVAHRDGEALTILELTGDQRERVKE
jgi:hypothetical protein